MMYEDIDEASVQRDMFGREITNTHNRRFSNSTPVRPPSNRNNNSSQLRTPPTEESPLLPVYNIDHEGEHDSDGDETDSIVNGVEQRSLTASDEGDLDSGMVSKRYFCTTLTLLTLVFLSFNLYFFQSLRVMHTHNYHQHQQINALQRSQHRALVALDSRLLKLENMTSNADVVAEMKDTERRVRNLVGAEQEDTARQLSALHSNVTDSLHRSQATVSHMLSSVDGRLANTTANIKSLLVASQANVSREISSVSLELQASERGLERLHANVTQQASAAAVMSVYVCAVCVCLFVCLSVCRCRYLSVSI